MAHALASLFAQLLLGLLAGDWWTPAAAMSALFIGREHAQAEYRWIERYGSGRRANMPWYGGLQPRVWTIKSLADCALPAAATSALALWVTYG